VAQNRSSPGISNRRSGLRNQGTPRRAQSPLPLRGHKVTKVAGSPFSGVAVERLARRQVGTGTLEKTAGDRLRAEEDGVTRLGVEARTPRGREYA
jgi:hypothetical protein